jgi:hypothetical protein
MQQSMDLQQVMQVSSTHQERELPSTTTKSCSHSLLQPSGSMPTGSQSQATQICRATAIDTACV